MKKEFKAFNGLQQKKDFYIERMKKHIKADELIQGTGYNGLKGCAVGCTLNNYSHIGYENELGIPFTIAIWEDQIFEALSKEESKLFPLEFLESVPVGADLSKVFNHMEIFLLTNDEISIITTCKEDESKKLYLELIALHQRTIDNKKVDGSEWKDIADRAYRAYIADIADRADIADMLRTKFIELIKNCK